MIAIIIVTYNGEKWISKCLDSVNSNNANFRVIIVDNNSTDLTLSHVEKYENVVLIPLQENVGFGKANNIGFCKAISLEAEYFVLLNQDAYLPSGALDEMSSFAQSNDHIHFFSPIHTYLDNNTIDLFFYQYFSVNFNNMNFLDMLKNNYLQVEFVNAACWFIKRQGLLKVGGFSPSFFHYEEDVNYCHRIYQKGFKFYVYTGVTIIHDREDSINRRIETSIKQEYLRKLKVLISNPNQSWSKWKEFKMLFKNCILNFLKLDVSHFAGYFLRIIWLRHINSKELIKNRDYSKLDGAFLLETTLNSNQEAG